MFKDIKAFLSSFFKKAKDRKLIKKYLGITLAGLLAILIPVIIIICYMQFKAPTVEEIQIEEISITMFDNDGHTILSETTDLNKIKESEFINTIYNMITAKDPAKKPEDFNEKPTFNLTILSEESSLTYKCYFSKDHSSSFIEDGMGNFFTPNESEYLIFLNSSFSQVVYPESTPPSLMIGKDTTVTPRTVDWSYKLKNESVQTSTNYKTESDIIPYMINGAIDFLFSETPTECNIKITSETGEVLFDGTPDETTDFTANDGDKFTVFINATWANEADSLSFGNQSYEFEIVCTKPSTIETTPQTALGGTIVKISISDVNNIDTIIYTAKEPQRDDAALEELYKFVPTFKKEGQNAYAFLPIPNTIGNDTFEFSVSYGIAKAEFSLSLSECKTAETISLSADDISFDITDETKELFAKVLHDAYTVPSDMILFADKFLSPEKYGLTKSTEYNTEISLGEENSFRFLANSYVSSSKEATAIKSANIGTVKAVGYSDILGNYVAIDHGAGLYTWYCGLSDIGVSKGDILKKGEFIGHSGSTTPLCSNGVNIFCTLYEKLINPSDILGQKLI